MMNKYQFTLWVALLLFPLWGLAQECVETQDVDAYVAELSAQCPIACGDDWTVTSVTADVDTAWVELEAPGVLGIFLSTLTEDSPGVKRLWKNQMLGFGQQWVRLVDLLVEADRPMVLVIRPQDSDSSSSVIFSPEDLKREKSASSAADSNLKGSADCAN